MYNRNIFKRMWPTLQPKETKSHIDDAYKALRCKKVINVVYSGRERLLETHSIGTDNNNKHVMLAWQLCDFSNRLESEGWRYIQFEFVHSLIITDRTSEAPRPGYKRPSSRMSVDADVELSNVNFTEPFEPEGPVVFQRPVGGKTA